LQHGEAASERVAGSAAYCSETRPAESRRRTFRNRR
jgi:hypothetical protein